MSREELLPPIGQHHIDLLERIYANSRLHEMNVCQLQDVPFLDLEAMIRAGLVVRKRRGHYNGIMVTEVGAKLCVVRQMFSSKSNGT